MPRAMREECDDDWLEHPSFEEIEANESIQAVVWLLLAGEGGWWTMTNIQKRLPYLDAEMINNRVWVMAHRHNQLIVRSTGHKEYAVNHWCRIPKDVTAGAAAAALRRRPNLKEI
jgi:hypothetical protein